jgi:hypothetical protein
MERFGDCRRGRSLAATGGMRVYDAAALQFSPDRLGVQPQHDDGSLLPYFIDLGDSDILDPSASYSCCRVESPGDDGI